MSWNLDCTLMRRSLLAHMSEGRIELHTKKFQFSWKSGYSISYLVFLAQWHFHGNKAFFWYSYLLQVLCNFLQKQFFANPPIAPISFLVFPAFTQTSFHAASRFSRSLKWRRHCFLSNLCPCWALSFRSRSRWNLKVATKWRWAFRTSSTLAHSTKSGGNEFSKTGS